MKLKSDFKIRLRFLIVNLEQVQIFAVMVELFVIEVNRLILESSQLQVLLPTNYQLCHSQQDSKSFKAFTQLNPNYFSLGFVARNLYFLTILVTEFGLPMFVFVFVGLFNPNSEIELFAHFQIDHLKLMFNQGFQVVRKIVFVVLRTCSEPNL